MAAPKPKSGDVTGRKKAELLAEQDEALKARQDELTMINAVIQTQNEHGVFDPVSGTLIAEDAEDAGVDVLGVDDTIEFPAVEIEDDEVVVRVNEDLTNVTVGAGTLFNFKMGQQYKVPRHVAAHLEERGLIWH